MRTLLAALALSLSLPAAAGDTDQAAAVEAIRTTDQDLVGGAEGDVERGSHAPAFSPKSRINAPSAIQVEGRPPHASRHGPGLGGAGVVQVTVPAFVTQPPEAACAGVAASPRIGASASASANSRRTGRVNSDRCLVYDMECFSLTTFQPLPSELQ